MTDLRKIDALVAEHIDHVPPEIIALGNDPDVIGTNPYSTDWSWTGELIADWQGDVLIKRQNGLWHVEFCRPSEEFGAWAETLPLAACLARLKAANVEVPE